MSEHREHANLRDTTGRPSPAFLQKLRELHALITEHAIPCECGGGLVTKIRSVDGRLQTTCGRCTSARTSIERRQLRLNRARR